MKQQYKDAFRVARLISKMDMSQDETVRFMETFKWGFTLGMFAKAMAAI